METETRFDVLSDAQDIAVIMRTGEDSYVYGAKPSLKTQRQLYEQSISNPVDKEIPVFQRHWNFDEEKGITGSNTFLALRFDRLALRPNGLWLPGLLKAKALEYHGKLENGVYRDYGSIVYSDGDPNKDFAEMLIPEAEKLKLELPLIVPFRSLDYSTEEDRIILGFVESPQGIISGKEARRQIKSLNYRGNFGVQRLDRNRDGYWNAYWCDLAVSNGDGRVDWICGEASRSELESAYNAFVERDYTTKIRKLEAEKTRLQDEMQRRQSQFAESLTRYI